MVGGFCLSRTRNLNILSLGRTARFAQVARAMPHDGAIIFSDLIGGGLINEPAVVCGARISVSDPY
jgi:hypothetical protein